jgi:phage/plasmid-like protein (TIGR03299 family)|tara:strand:- start:2226 stop:3236 length:1011 start_codon:yes stop_codon:yes gene_type:complete
MSHLIDSMFYVGETPWHGLGTALDKPPTIEEALKLAGLNWNVSKVPTYYEITQNNLGGGTSCRDKETGHFVTIRDDKQSVLGNVGTKYEVLQNQEAFEPFKVILDYGFTLETAGSIDEGKKVWILAKTPEKYLVGDDAVDDYILMYTSHDGSSGSCFRDVYIRVVCNNTLQAGLGRGTSVEYKLRHTSSIHERVNELTTQLKERNGNVKLAMDEMNRMVDVDMTPEMLKLYIESVMPVLKNRHRESVPELGIWVRNKTKPVYDKITDLFYNGKGNKGRTVWDAYNAITEYHDHHKKHQSDWVKSTQFGQSNLDKRRAFLVASQIAKKSASTQIGVS